MSNDFVTMRRTSCYVLYFGLITVLFKVSAVAAGTPISVKKEETKSLSLVQLVLRPNYTSDVKVAPDALLSDLSKDIKDAGYNVVGASDESMFNKNDPNKAEMQLGGTINHLECQVNRNYKEIYECNIAVLWELYSTRKGEVVYKVLTRYRREVSLDNKYIEKEVKSLLLGTLSSLLSRGQFVESMKKSGDTAGSATTDRYVQSTFTACKTEPLVLPTDLEKAKQATVLIQVGAVIGSGFFISPDGFLLTAYHVTEGADDITVRRPNGEEHKAVVIREDRVNDVALLKVDVSEIPCLRIAAADAVVGTDIYAVGAPGFTELAFSVSKGIVSGLRTVEGQAFIQTDAGINAGNSGGPLLNQQGEAVAVVSWKIAIPGFEGLGFGVPTPLAAEKLAIEAGGVSSIAVAADSPTKTEVKTAAVEDEPDPTFESLSLARTDIEKEWRYSTKDRQFYAGWRYPLIIGGPILMVAGGVMMAKSYLDYKDYEDAADGYDPQYVRQDDWDKTKMINTIGWALAGVGTGALVLFLATPRSKEKIREVKENEMRKAAKAGGKGPAVTLNVEFSGAGLTLQGKF